MDACLYLFFTALPLASDSTISPKQVRAVKTLESRLVPPVQRYSPRLLYLHSLDDRELFVARKSRWVEPGNAICAPE